MPPKKNKGAKISLAEFNESAGIFRTSDTSKATNWADEMDDVPAIPGFTSSQPGYSNASSGVYERRSYDSAPRESNYASTRSGDMERAGWTAREEVPLPDRPPYTAHIGNLSFDATEAEIGDFFASAGASVKGVRLMRDRETERARGFGYVEFNDLESLKVSLPLSGSPLAGRDVRVTVAEAPKGYGDREPERELDWGAARTRGPPPARERSGYERSGYERSDRGYDRSERFENREPRSPREPERELDWGAARTRGPLPPAEKPAYERRERPERRDSDRPVREERSDLDWNKRGQQPESTTTERRKLSLAPRSTSGTVTPAVSSPSSKASPFGAAKAVDTSAAERKAEEKRQQMIKEREAAAAAATAATTSASSDKKKDKKFDPRTDKPFDVLRRTDELTLDDKEEEKDEDEKVEAEQVKDESEPGWTVKAKK